MTSFPDGQLLLREFRTLTEAHQAASVLSSSPELQSENAFRLIDVSPTAEGAWVCGWISNSDPLAGEQLAKHSRFDVVDVNGKLMNALLSLGPKAGEKTTRIGIVESTKTAEVLRTAMTYLKSGLTLLEVRVKRSGPVGGAYAFFALDDQDIEQLRIAAPASLVMTTIPLVGDYRRYFL